MSLRAFEIAVGVTLSGTVAVIAWISTHDPMAVIAAGLLTAGSFSLLMRYLEPKSFT